MSTEDEAFLARWSRRKRAAASVARSRPTVEKAEAAPAPARSEVPAAPETAQPAIDLASLPPIESIGAGSDIRAFLAPGVPLDLARAALRRAWSADPTIRNFIGLSENSWDFNAPDAIPGFGSISADDVRRLLAQLGGEPKPPGQSDPISVPPQEPAPGVVGSSPPGSDLPAAEEEPRVASGTAHGAESSDIATQHDAGAPDRRSRPPRLPWRRHGGALPE
jgi:hypothetical protein